MTSLRVELVDCRQTNRVSRNCELDGRNSEEADFHEPDLSGCVMRGCSLARADLRGTNLRNTDFRKSEVHGMVVGISDLRGAIVEAAQAMIFERGWGFRSK